MADSFFRFWGRKTREADGVPASTIDQKSEVKGGSFDERIVFASNPQVALTVSAVYRAIELHANTQGMMPVQLRKKDFQKGNFVPWMEGLGRRVNYLLQEEPNPITTASSLWKQVTINRLQLGNAFVYIERDTFGDPLYLWLAICGGYDMVNGTYNLTYLSENGPVSMPNVPRANVLHFPNTYRRQEGFWGISTLDYAKESLSFIKTQKAQALETAAKGGRVKLIIGEDTSRVQSPIAAGLFDKKEMNKYAEEIQHLLYANDVVAMRGLDKVQNISMTAQDMQMIDQLGMTYDDVARFYGVPRPLLMLDTNSHYNDYSNATMEFLTRTILPDKTEREKEIFRKLVGSKYYGTLDIHICERPLLSMDPERQAKVDQLNLQTGAKTVNEIRAEHDMPSVENGDIVYVSTNLAELGSAKLRENGGGRPSNNSKEDNDGESK